MNIIIFSVHVVLHFSVFHVLADFRHAMATRPFAACMLLYCISYLIYIFVCSKLSPRGFGVVGRRVRWPLGSGGGPRARSAGGTCGLGVGWESAGLGSVLVLAVDGGEGSAHPPLLKKSMREGTAHPHFYLWGRALPTPTRTTQCLWRRALPTPRLSPVFLICPAPGLRGCTPILKNHNGGGQCPPSISLVEEGSAHPHSPTTSKTFRRFEEKSEQCKLKDNVESIMFVTWN